MGIDIPDIPTQMQEMVVCSILASIHYDVPTNVLLAIADKEGVFGDNYSVRSGDNYLDRLTDM